MGYELPLAMLMSAAGSVVGGGGDDQKGTWTGLGAPQQSNLLNQLLFSMQRGDGEFGFGPAARQARATMGRQAENRGLSLDSGVMQSSLAQMMSQAMSADVQNRREYAAHLINSRPWTVNYSQPDHTMHGRPPVTPQTSRYF